MSNEERPSRNVRDYYPDPNRDYNDPRTAETEEEEEARKAGWTHFNSGESHARNPYEEDRNANEDSYYYNRENTAEDEDDDLDDGRMTTCPHCHNEVSARSNFCNICGYHFQKEQETTYALKNERIDGYLIDDICNFVGPNYAVYLKKFEKVSEGRISFNWAAAILSNRWMAYRGMFRQALGFSILINLLSGIISFLILYMFRSTGVSMTDTTSSQITYFSFMLTVAIGLIAGLLGDKMYWKHARRHMDRMQCQDREPVSDSRIRGYLRKAGAVRLSYALLIVMMDYTLNEVIVTVLQYYFNLG